MEIEINTEAYDHLGDRWYTAYDDPIALLRAQSKLRNPWILAQISEKLGGAPLQILDIGCGAGFLSNDLALHHHHVTGMDLSLNALDVAKKHDTTGSVQYMNADVSTLPFPAAKFDVVCAMDFLEHVESPASLILEISRVLKPGSLFFFHTFNRNFLSRLLAIKALEWFIRNTPKNMHLYRLFIRPEELARYCQDANMDQIQFRGLAPASLNHLAQILFTGQIPRDFRFKFTKSLSVGYSGFARRN